MGVAHKILLWGANGQVGARLVQACAERGVACVPLTRAEVDLAALNPHRLRALIEAHAPTHLINAAAYTAVDKAESEKELAYKINAEAPKLLVEAAQSFDLPCIHFSTDYVFDGLGGAPYSETAITHPLNVYGASKLDGEQAVLDAGGTVFRLQWVYDTRGSNFFLRMRELMSPPLSPPASGGGRGGLRIVADQLGAPTFAKHIATAVLDALAIPRGLYHLAAQGFTSWHGFTCAIHAGMPQTVTQSILPIASTEYPLAATRPLDTRLNTDKLAAHGIALPHWQEGLREAMEELHATA